MMVLELIKDKETLAFFEPEQEAEKLFQALALKNGLVMYGTLYGPRRQPAFRRGLPAWISPPLSITSDETTLMMQRLDATLTEWEATVL
jgi:adenosylmethionine-8-amino-7-oxononanoate aminotransferase